MEARTIVYLTLSGLSSFVELGVIIMALRSGASLAETIGLVLCYQLAGLLKNPIQVSLRLARIALICVAFVTVLKMPQLWLLAITYFLLIVGLQTVRDLAGEGINVSTPRKRTTRIVGFALSGVLVSELLPLVAAACLAGSLALGPAHESRQVRIREWHPGWLGVTMVVHQAHYFCYASVIPFLFLANGLEPSAAAAAFAFGWVSYTAAQFLFEHASDVAGFIFGHLLAAAMLVVMFFTTNETLPLVLAWIGTGFGGGTVFLLRRRQDRLLGKQADLDLWENVGHVAGVLLALNIVILGGGAQAVVLCAVGLALGTACLMALSNLDGRTHHPGSHSIQHGTVQQSLAQQGGRIEN